MAVFAGAAENVAVVVVGVVVGVGSAATEATCGSRRWSGG